MKYIVSSALDHSHQLNTVQRTSPYFSEAPVVAGHTLRRGSRVTLTEEQFQISRVQIERLVRAQAIEVMEVSETGAGPIALSQESADEPAAEVAAPTEVAPPAEPPVVESPPDSGSGNADGEAGQATPTDAEDSAVASPAPAVESASAVVPAASRRGKKGRQS